MGKGLFLSGMQGPHTGAICPSSRAQSISWSPTRPRAQSDPHRPRHRPAAGLGPGGNHAPGTDGELIPLDIDATIVIAYSDKQQAAPTWKKTFGFHPMTVFADHGPAGGGEPLAWVLRPGNAGSNTAADHITAIRLALARLPRLIRADSGGGTPEFLSWLSRPGRRLSYSIGFTLTEEIQAAILERFSS